MDRCRLGAAQDGPHVTRQVVTVGYQGAMVRVTVMTEAGEGISVPVPDRLFRQKPAEPGQQATPAWAPREADAQMEVRRG